MDLFEQSYQQKVREQAPLAERMRPRTLDEFVGQNHIIGAGRLLRRAIVGDQLSSLIFFGPPGTGKTTLARIIAQTTHAHFMAINAVLAGIKDIREAISTATEQGKYYQQKTILFVDEVHRFNKSQQDALLPWVENGTIILIGATTENPYFEVNKALVSRSRLFQLKPLTPEDLAQVISQALADSERGYGQSAVHIEAEAITHLTNVANGDARSLLNALELAVETTPPNEARIIHIDLAVAEESIQQRAVLYDKQGESHFDTISAFIKSIRGSDPDAALYWLAKMIYAGEDPRFILRRLLILASEDVGLADPNALVITNSCAQAFDRVGMPEGRYMIAQATLYLATAPKSNSVMGFFDALGAVEEELHNDIPNHLKDANRDQKAMGHGANYLYPHAYRDHWVEQQYLPTGLQGRVFYQPSDLGREAEIKTQVARRREAQLAAQIEGIGVTSMSMLTYSQTDKQVERWFERTIDQTGQKLSQIRDRLLALAPLQRHHLILDLNAKSGLLTWEALRQVPEGGVYACVSHPTEAFALREQAKNLPELLRPIVLTASLNQLPHVLAEQDKDIRFDCIMGRNALSIEKDKVKMLNNLIPWLSPQGVLILAETLPRHTQRLYDLLQPEWLPSELLDKLKIAESAIYQDTSDPMVNWDGFDLQKDLQKAGLTVKVEQQRSHTSILITTALVERWFATTQINHRPTYRQHLKNKLTDNQINHVKQVFTKYLLNQTVNWSSTVAYLKASLARETHV
ncbi:AAA family ATPase [Crocosphaera sp. Alani8]|uniref:AAA family ATPase n=1 Tax=Crocosphaera sp. Alani8 TaxID=3038952 RepID=UPI00313EA07E